MRYLKHLWLVLALCMPALFTQPAAAEPVISGHYASWLHEKATAVATVQAEKAETAALASRTSTSLPSVPTAAHDLALSYVQSLTAWHPITASDPGNGDTTDLSTMAYQVRPNNDGRTCTA